MLHLAQQKDTTNSSIIFSLFWKTCLQSVKISDFGNIGNKAVNNFTVASVKVSSLKKRRKWFFDFKC